MIVIDTMILTYFLLQHPGFTEEVDPVFSANLTYGAPPLWRSELRNSLLQYMGAADPNLPGNRLELADALAHMRDAEHLLDTHTYEVDSAEVLSLAFKSTCSAYDCEYVALAQALEVQLVTFDQKVLDAFPETAVHPKNFQPPEEESE